MTISTQEQLTPTDHRSSKRWPADDRSVSCLRHNHSSIITDDPHQRSFTN